MNNILSCLFKTGALRICRPDRPFWYTSGTLGPYYINTHFLWGSEEKALLALKLIDENKEDLLGFSQMFYSHARKNYQEDPVYAKVIDQLVNQIKTNFDDCAYDYISGGERRDWFFSFMAAGLLNKPHLTLYKDKRAVLIDENNRAFIAHDLQGKKVLHIADLITQASSYERSWYPAIGDLFGQLAATFVIVDRNQGGADFFKKHHIKFYPMVSIDGSTFDRALSLGLIDGDAHSMITAYLKDPKSSMGEFLLKNPGFLDETIKGGGPDAKRALLCKEKNTYNL